MFPASSGSSVRQWMSWNTIEHDLVHKWYLRDFHSRRFRSQCPSHHFWSIFYTFNKLYSVCHHLQRPNSSTAMNSNCLTGGESRDFRWFPAFIEAWAWLAFPHRLVCFICPTGPVLDLAQHVLQLSFNGDWLVSENGPNTLSVYIIHLGHFIVSPDQKAGVQLAHCLD